MDLLPLLGTNVVVSLDTDGVLLWGALATHSATT